MLSSSIFRAMISDRSIRDDTMMLKRHRPSVELLPHDVVELILERLSPKPLLRFKTVSKQWKSTIESPCFEEKQFNHRRQSRGLDVLFVSGDGDGGGDDEEAERMRIVLGSSVISKAKTYGLGSMVTHGSCDGLICTFSVYDPSFLIYPASGWSFLINPATGWYQSFPFSGFQHLSIERFSKGDFGIPCPRLGLGKDKLKGTYKPVWLYNSSEFGLDNVTTCEVFDFSTNAWRYVLHASPYRIISCHRPVYLDGSLYWFTECEETKILSFDLHTENFQVVSKTPFARVLDPQDVAMCILDDRLCVSEKNWPTQVIWSFDGNNKTWEELCSIDLAKIYAWLRDPGSALWPLAILDKTKLLLHGRFCFQPLIIHDLHTKSYDLSFEPTGMGNFVYYFQSLFSALSN